jgi:hypothetical protein
MIFGGGASSRMSGALFILFGIGARRQSLHQINLQQSCNVRFMDRKNELCGAHGRSILAYAALALGFSYTLFTGIGRLLWHGEALTNPLLPAVSSEFLSSWNS